MKKILILTSALIFSISQIAYGACTVDSLGLCQSGITTQELGSTNLQNRLIPNRINNMGQPNTLMENRGMQGQTQTPENINRELCQQESTQPYNSNCQFGNCINKTNAGINIGF
jgi:hypothetical protein